MAAFGFFAQQNPQELDKKVTISLSGKFSDFVALLRQKLGVNIFVDPRCEKEVDLEATKELRLKDVRGSSALRWVTYLYGLDFAVQAGTVVIGRTAWVNPPVLRSYDVRSLMTTRSDSPGPRVSIGGSRLIGYIVSTDEPKSVIPNGDTVVDLIKGNVSPGLWEESDVSIEFAPQGWLVVQQTPQVHEEISRFLSLLGAISEPTITVSAGIVEADETSSNLIKPGEIGLFGPAEIEKLAEKLPRGKARSLQVTSGVTQRAHVVMTEESTAIVDWDKDDVVVSTGVTEVVVLDCRPVLDAPRRYITLELRMSLGQTTPIPPTLKHRGRDLAFREDTLTRLSTTLRIPNGGGVLFALPAKSAFRGKTQLCLLRASSVPGSEETPRVTGVDEPSSQERLLEQLRKLPKATVSFENTFVEEALKWFAEATATNVVIQVAPGEHRLTLTVANLELDKVLKLMLAPLGLDWVVRDEALLVLPRDRSSDIRTRTRVEIFDVRDTTLRVQDFPGPEEDDGPRSSFTGEDLAQVIKNRVHRDRWEESEGAAIQYHEGMLVVRNTPEVLGAVRSYLAEMRRTLLRIVSMRAETMLVPAAAADSILGRAGTDSHLLLPAQYERLVQIGTFQEQVGWHSLESQKTCVAWDRSVGFLRDLDNGDDPIPDAVQTRSYLTTRSVLSRDQKSILVDLVFQDQRILEIRNVAVSKDVSIQTPLMHGASTRATLYVPEDRIAVFKWSVPAREGAERYYRLLLLKPVLWKQE